LVSNPRPELIQQILQNHLQIQKRIRGDAPGAWLALNLTFAQLKSLFFINSEGQTNLRNVAAALGVTPPNITGIVDRLVEHELVSREYNLQNRREQILKLTGKGEELIDKLVELTTASFTQALNRMETQDLSALAQGLKALSIAAQGEKPMADGEVQKDAAPG